MPNFTVTLNGEYPLEYASSVKIDEVNKVDFKHDFSDILEESIKEHMFDSGMGMQNRIDKAVKRLFASTKVKQSEMILSHTVEEDVFFPELTHGTVPGEEIYTQKTKITLDFQDGKTLDGLGLGSSEWMDLFTESAKELGFKDDMFAFELSQDFANITNACDVKRDKAIETLYTVVPKDVPSLLRSTDIGTLKQLPSKGDLAVVAADNFTLPLYPASIDSLLPDDLQSITVKNAREHLGTSIFSIQSDRKEKAPSFPDFSAVKMGYNALKLGKEVLATLRAYDGHPKLPEAFNAAITSANLTSEETSRTLINLASFAFINNNSSLFHNITSASEKSYDPGATLEDKISNIQTLVEGNNPATALNLALELGQSELSMAEKHIKLDKPSEQTPEGVHNSLKI